jgi:rod shape determining protein RodA
MSNDFSRVAEVSSGELGARSRFLRVLHIDLWLVLPLLILSIGGLFVLYSASGQSDVMLGAQMRNIVVAMAVLLITAQFRVETLRGVSPYIFAAGHATARRGGIFWGWVRREPSVG